MQSPHIVLKLWDSPSSDSKWETDSDTRRSRFTVHFKFISESERKSRRHVNGASLWSREETGRVGSAAPDDGCLLVSGRTHLVEEARSPREPVTRSPHLSGQVTRSLTQPEPT